MQGRYPFRGAVSTNNVLQQQDTFRFVLGADQLWKGYCPTFNFTIGSSWLFHLSSTSMSSPIRAPISSSSLSGSSACRPRLLSGLSSSLLGLPAPPVNTLFRRLHCPAYVHPSLVPLSASFHATVRGMIEVRIDARVVREFLTRLLSPPRSGGRISMNFQLPVAAPF